MMKLDCTGLACPQPVLKTREALEEAGEGTVTVLVDNPAARENVERYARSQGFEVGVAPLEGGLYELTIEKSGGACAVLVEPAAADLPRALLLLTDRMGADSQLGGVLMRAFVATLSKGTKPPAKLILMNSGVRLTTEGSPVLEEMDALARTGCEILSCGLCLDYFGLKDALRAGRVTNMYDTVETLTHGHIVTTIG